MRISIHAIEQYCLRKYGDCCYYISNPVREELEKRLDKAISSDFSPKQFFQGRTGTKNVTLKQDNELVYAIRKGNLFTVLNIPGTDPISDFLNKKR